MIMEQEEVKKQTYCPLVLKNNRKSYMDKALEK